MSKKILKRATSAIRTISLAIGSMSLLVIAIDQITEKQVCTTYSYSINKQIRFL
tara:strand:- start:414 stop:575 length:162 start_codon:yes stop_codon:yes gene_type:complete